MQYVVSVVLLAVALVCTHPLLADSNGAPTESKEVKSVADATLPDAPMPQAAASTTGNAIHYAPLYARTVFPGETAHRLTNKQKFLYAGRQIIEPIALVPALGSAVWDQWRNGDPRYGTDGAAFAERFGAAVARENSYRFLTDGLMPVVLHEDPRYYRLGEGSALRRMTYAFVQTFVTHTDDGRQTFNYGGWIGRALGASMTYIYYPEPSRNGGVVLRTFGTSLGGLTAYDEFREFLPRAIFTKLDIFR